MDKLSCYRVLIQQNLRQRAELMRGQPLAGEEIVCLLDEATDNYILLRLGWLQSTRLYSVTIHVRLKDDQVYIEQDWTDDFAADLLDAGVCREDLVPAFAPPIMRMQSDAVAAA